MRELQSKIKWRVFFWPTVYDIVFLLSVYYGVMCKVILVDDCCYSGWLNHLPSFYICENKVPTEST